MTSLVTKAARRKNRERMKAYSHDVHKLSWKNRSLSSFFHQYLVNWKENWSEPEIRPPLEMIMVRFYRAVHETVTQASSRFACGGFLVSPCPCGWRLPNEGNVSFLLIKD